MSSPKTALIRLDLLVRNSGLAPVLKDLAGLYGATIELRDRDGMPVFRAGGSLSWRAAAPSESAAVEVRGDRLGEVAVAGAIDGGPMAGRVAGLLSELGEKEYELNDLAQEILDSYEEVNLFYDIAAELGTTQDVAGVCSVILRKACEIVGASRATILLLDGTGEFLRIAAAVGIPREEWAGVRIAPGQGISGVVLTSRTPQLVDDVGRLPQGMLAGYESYVTRSFVSVPLCLGRGPGRRESARAGEAVSAERAIGVLNMTDKHDGSDFTSGDLKLLTALAGQAAVLIENMRLIDLKRELRVARDIQQGLLPAAPPAVAGLEVAGMCIPAHNVGGDCYDFVPGGPGGELGAVVADVSGHNLASALMMAVARSALRTGLRRGLGPAHALTHANSALFEDLERSGLFLSVFCLTFDPAARRLSYSNAGHPSALLLRAGEDLARPLTDGGMLVGIFPDSGYEESAVVLGPGDLVLVYTDGLVETRNDAGELYGVGRLELALRRLRDESPADVLAGLAEEGNRFREGRPPEDDVTAVLLKSLPPEVR